MCVKGFFGETGFRHMNISISIHIYIYMCIYIYLNKINLYIYKYVYIYMLQPLNSQSWKAPACHTASKISCGRRIGTWWGTASDSPGT
jgi:hypothetical protein